MEITRGKINGAQKVVLYGPEGIGKSTFAALFPKPVFVDTEGSTKHMDVDRLPKPTSFQMIFEEIAYIKSNPGQYKTFVIDTIDWAEKLCNAEVCAKYHKNGIEEFGYGNGYVYAAENMGRLLNALEELIDIGINVVLTAHAKLRKFEQPDEMGSYDRWELKLGAKTVSQIAPMVKEWADMVLFANYKTFSVAVDDKGKKHKAAGGKRVMYTSHHPCWDAKNRHSLPEELPFNYAEIQMCIEGVPPVIRELPEEHPPVTAAVTAMTPSVERNPAPSGTAPVSDAVKERTAAADSMASKEPSHAEARKEPPAREEPLPPTFSTDIPGVPKALSDLMKVNGVTATELQQAVAYNGSFPEDTPIGNYGEEFINSRLIPHWDGVIKCIERIREYQIF